MAKRARFQDLPLGPRPAGVPLHRWLYDELRRAIVGGRLRAGARLPSSRELARQQSVARSTVVAVFEQLVVEGYLAGRTGSGTVVARQLPDVAVAAPGHRSAGLLGATGRRADLSAVGRLSASARPPDASAPVRAFRLHEPALDCFPIDRWVQLSARRLRLTGRELLARGDAAGWMPLRKAVAGYLNSTRGVHCDVGQVVIVSGTQQALDCVARLLLDPGDPVWVEDPGYPGAVRAFRTAGARVVPVPVDRQGLDPEAGRVREPRPKLVYVTPAHQFPLGATLSLERRLALLALAERTGGWIFEDDYDGEYRYDARPIGALQGHDRHGAVIYAGSFSKMLFSSLRLGFVVLPPTLVEPFINLRANVDRYPPLLDQAVLADFMNEGYFDRHIRRSRAVCRERRDVVLEASARTLAGLVDIQRTEAGFHLLGRMPDDLPDLEVRRRAEEAGVDVAALSRVSVGHRKVNGLLLGFAPVPPPAILAGIDVLARVLESFTPAPRRAGRTRMSA